MTLAATGFDGLYLAPEVIRQILIGLHADGTISHHWQLDVAGRVVEAMVQPVQRCWIDSVPRRGSGRHPTDTYPLMCDVPLYINVRDASRLGDEGACGRAVAHLALLFEVPAHQGVVPDKFAHSVRFDFTSTVAADIELPPAMAGDKTLQQAIVDLVHATFSGTYPLPPGELRDLSAQHPIEIVPVLSPTPQLVARPVPPMKNASGRLLATAPAQGVALDADGRAAWRLVLAPERMLPLASRLLPRLMQQELGRAVLGAGSELAKATLRDGRLDLEVTPGGARSSSLLNVGVEAAPPAQGKLRWSIVGGRLPAKAPLVVTADDLGLTPPAATPARRPSVSFLTEKHELLPGGLHVSGRVEALAGSGPIAEFQWLRQPRSDVLVTFHAGRSWSPGASIDQLVWDFGDGTVQTLHAPDIDIVVVHRFAGRGPFGVTLTVVDDAQRQSSVRLSLELAALRLVALTPPVRTADGSLASRVRVLMGNSPVRDAQLALEVNGARLTARSDADGFAELRGAFAPFVGTFGKPGAARQRVGHAAEVAVEINGRRTSVSTTAMDGDIFAALVDATLTCRRHAQSGSDSGSGSDSARGSATGHLRRRALALSTALWRGDVPSWGAPRGNVDLRQPVGADGVRTLQERVTSMAARAKR